MVALFVLIMVKRDTIRAYWWVHRLRNSTALADRAYYVACLAGVGDSAKEALRNLGEDERAENRSLVIPASQGLDLMPRLSLLRHRLFDCDPDVRLSAATAISFMQPDVATLFLKDASRAEDPKVATAGLSGLARMNTPEALAAICESAAKDSRPWVRAQAIESLGQQLASESAAVLASASTGGAIACDPLTILVSALEDSAEFSERLSLEMEIAAVNRAVTLKGHSTSKTAITRTNHRTVAQIAATTLTALTGRTFDRKDALTPEAKKRLVLTLKDEIARRNATSRPANNQ